MITLIFQGVHNTTTLEQSLAELENQHYTKNTTNQLLISGL